jgi:sec-independent protein translocase protein TatA
VIGGMEWILLILFVVLLLFGAKKIPEFARSLGKAKAEFQRGQIQVQREIDAEKAQYEAGRQKPQKEVYDMRSQKVVKAAEALGINTIGKSEDDLKAEIASNIS